MWDGGKHGCNLDYSTGWSDAIVYDLSESVPNEYDIGWACWAYWRGASSLGKEAEWTSLFPPPPPAPDPVIPDSGLTDGNQVAQMTEGLIYNNGVFVPEHTVSGMVYNPETGQYEQP